MAEAEAAFDEFQPYYDLMVDWEKRLAHEAPFFQRVFASASARRVLDCACGTGHHVRLFARWGLEVVGSDASEAMVAQARDETPASAGRIRFEVADFTELPRHFADEPFDALICTGNSLPLAGSSDRLRQAVKGMYDVLNPGGVVVLQALNFAQFTEGQNVFRGPRVRRVDDREILFLKIFRRRRRLCDMDLVVLEKQAGEWTRSETRTRAWALHQSELELLATDIGFGRLQWYGGYEPKPFDPGTSQDLILVARKER